MEKRVIAITGAGKGIGYETAKKFAEAGDLLALNYRKTSQNLPKIVELAKSNGGDAIVIQGDMSKNEEAVSFIKEAEKHYGRIDVLVNNAGILRSQDATTVTYDQFLETINTNLGSAFSCSVAVLPGMVERKSGRIINVSSELGIIGFRTYSHYCASKAGVIGMTKAMAKEFAPLGILINSIAPGPVDTDMLKYDTIEYNDEEREAVPLKRFGQPEEIAAMIEALAGPAGSFMVGQIVSPNGGTAI